MFINYGTLAPHFNKFGVCISLIRETIVHVSEHYAALLLQTIDPLIPKLVRKVDVTRATLLPFLAL